MRDLVIRFRTNFLTKLAFFKRKKESFFTGNNRIFLFAKIDINKSVIKIVNIISKTLLKKYLNLNRNKSFCEVENFSLKRSKIVLTSLQQQFRP